MAPWEQRTRSVSVRGMAPTSGITIKDQFDQQMRVKEAFVVTALAGVISMQMYWRQSTHS